MLMRNLPNEGKLEKLKERVKYLMRLLQYLMKLLTMLEKVRVPIEVRNRKNGENLLQK